MTYTANYLITGQEYEFTIVAKNVIGMSVKTSPALRMIAAIQPSTPSTPRAINISSTKLIFKWDPPFDNGGS